MTCPKCGSRDTRRATAYWQCLTCKHEWQTRTRDEPKRPS